MRERAKERAEVRQAAPSAEAIKRDSKRIYFEFRK